MDKKLKFIGRYKSSCKCEGGRLVKDSQSVISLINFQGGVQQFRVSQIYEFNNTKEYQYYLNLGYKVNSAKLKYFKPI